ncbi:9081_t:CDS:10 [Acaulospora colombiana]|uniref:9081_t:CDS:1 n=1 Tax=Acaulospora colombiana TaxID=27376 RepID=A0ACA9JXV0_9GLOM|nr:9081_t:CDS:10 [Acaulospora colombiana]
MYTQPPPNSQQSTQRPIPNQSQSQPLTPQVVPSPTQQNFPGWRPAGTNAQPLRPPPQNVRPGFIPGQRPPQTVASGIRPVMQGQPPTVVAQQPPQVNAFLGSGPPVIPPPGSVYPQSNIPTRPPGPPGPMRPQQGLDVTGMGDMVNQVSNMEISPRPPVIQNTSILNQPQIDQPARPPRQNRTKRAYHPSSDINGSSYTSLTPFPNNYNQPPPVDNAPQPGQQPMQPMYSPMVPQHPPTVQGMQQTMQPIPHQAPYMHPPSQTQPMPRPPIQNPPRSRIDPNQIPSPVTVQEQDQQLFDEQPYMTLSKSTVPLASSDFKAVDEGNSNPRFMRLTLYSIPHSEDLLQTSHLPLGVILQPLAKLRNDEAPIEVVDFQEQGPIRCTRCKTYINPFVIFVEGGQKFICNMCSFSNEVPPEYFCNLDMSGRRVDIEQRPELKYGTVEFTAPKEYWARPPSPLSCLFAIDVSFNAVKSGMVATCVNAILEILYNSPSGISPINRIGIVTYDRDVHFYSLQPQLEQAQMLVVSDINDVFVPLNSGLFVDPNESRTVIEDLLKSLPTMFAENKVMDAVLGAVVKASHMALNEIGGKLVIFQTTLPTYGPGSIKHREDSKVYNTDKERLLFGPQDNYYKTLATSCVDSGICVDLFLFPNSYIDIATIGILSCLTGGETYFYPNFDAQRDGVKFSNELMQNLTREFGYNALMRIRCSNGLRVEDHFGNFNMRNATDVELAGVDSDKAFGALFKYDGKLDEKTDAYIQCALLYTTSSGQRRVRTHNLSVTVTQLLGNVFRHAEMDTTVNFLAKQAVSNTLTKSLRDIRDHLTEKCVKILMAYRRHCATSSSSGQLILPEAFKLFPLYTLTMLKSKALCGGNLTSDVRVHCMRLIKSIGVPDSVVFFYPRLFPVHQLSDQVGFPDQYGRVKLPPLIRVSQARFSHDGAYLLENGQILMFWLGHQISPDFIRSVFGVESIEHINPKLNKTSIQIRSIITYLQSQRSKYLRLTIVRKGIDPSELEFNCLLAEDENNGAMSYVDYLCHVHKQIQAEVNMSD